VNVDLHLAAIVLASALACASLGYLVIAETRMRRFLAPGPRAAAAPRPVTVLKPLCGLDVELEANLRSFCAQQHPEFQVLFGVRDAGDPAIPVAERVIADHPDLDLELVVDDRAAGTNFKICNLINMAPRIRHDIIVVADSDMRATPDYLGQVTAPFADPRVGAVTCLYRGSAVDGGSSLGRLASRLGAMFVNDWFAPSVLVSLGLRPVRFCLGATMAVRRSVLESLGGFECLADELADDYLLGRRVAQAGHAIVLSDYVIENVMHETGPRALLAHELRWARTMRSMEPAGFGAAIVTDTVPLTALTAALVLASGGGAALALGPLVAALALRLLGHIATARALRVRQGPTPWLIPLRDCLTMAVRIASFLPGRVEWRGHTFGLDRSGRLHRLEQAGPSTSRHDEQQRVAASS
jgi:ceramide glucosyltransferase